MGTPVKSPKPPSRPESSQRPQQTSKNGDIKAKKRITNDSDDDDDFILSPKKRKAQDGKIPSCCLQHCIPRGSLELDSFEFDWERPVF